MSILIRDMTMPNRCFECIFLATVPNFFCLAGKRDLCAEHGINISRPDWCPLTELPSHGRLGDLDKLNIHDISPVDGFCVMGVTEEDIELAETVIEAEGETE